ncbi:MAG: HD domain-containing protein [Meiothermus sp.]|nr:HD domain-containing protein [Meiothermus sp.]
MTQQGHIEALAERVKLLSVAEGSHDWWHVWRVWRLARRIALEEGADLYLVELAALCHDLEDWKYADHQPVIRPLLERLEVAPEVVGQVLDICERISFKGAGVPDRMEGLEGRVVQDADRLDALGAIGVARTFAYGGSKSRPLHDPDEQIELHGSFEAYKSKSGSSLAHFHEKLYLLIDRLHTPAAHRIAEARDAFMREFERKFLLEWNGQD